MFQEYVDYYGSAGVQHIAMRTFDIIQTVSTHRLSETVCLLVLLGSITKRSGTLLTVSTSELDIVT